MGTVKIFAATAYVTLIREKLVTVASMIADVLIMRNANGTFARLIAVMAGVIAMRTVGSAAETALALVIKGVIILEAVILIVVMVNVIVMRTVSHVMTVVVKRIKNVPLAQQMLTREVVLTGVVMVL